MAKNARTQVTLPTPYAGEQPLLPKETHAQAQNLKTVDDFVKLYWNRFAYSPSPNVFEHGGVSIAKDGGMSDVGDKLLYDAQYLYAALSVSFVTANTYMLTTADVMAIMRARQANAEASEIESEFLLSKWVVQSIFGKWFPLVGSKIEQLVPLFELIVLWGLLTTAAIHIFGAVFAPRLYKERTWMMKRWMHTKEFFWVIMPNLASFSAMRLLYYVTPSVIGTEAYVVGYLVIQSWGVSKDALDRLKSIYPIVIYLLKLLLCVCIGFDAFLVKFRMAEQYINGKKDEDMDSACLLGAVVFLFQILGVVNLNFFVRLRLFIFIFGGEDGNFDIDEKARTDVWNAMLARKIYQEHGPIKGTIIMLGFDDYDFQLLVLEDEVRKRLKAKTHKEALEFRLKGGVMDDFQALGSMLE